MAKKIRRNDNRTPEQRKASAAQRGLDREAHFESGGSTREWTGGKVVHKSRKNKGTRSVNKRKAIGEY